MMTKTTVVSLFALSLLALSGIGYAAFTSTIYVSGSASAGTLILNFANPATPGTSTPTGVGTCAFSGTGGSTTFTVSNLAPGDSCEAYITITNSGTLPTSSESTSLSGLTNICWGSEPVNCFVVEDTLGLNSATTATGSGGPVGVGGSFSYGVLVALSPGSTTQSESGSFTISVTGSVGS